MNTKDLEELFPDEEKAQEKISGLYVLRSHFPEMYQHPERRIGIDQWPLTVPGFASVLIQSVGTYRTEHIGELVQRIENLERRIGNLEKMITEIKQAISQRPTVKQVWLMDLSNDDFQIKASIPISIEEYEDEILATWPELELYSSAETETAAIMGLKRNIMELFAELVSMKDESLGKLPKSWKRILAHHIERNHGQT